VGLAGWTSSIRITPTTISWYNGSTLEGQLDQNGMSFYYGTKLVGRMGETYWSGNSSIRGITMDLDPQNGFIVWNCHSSSGLWFNALTLDPGGSISAGNAGIHIGMGFYTHGQNFYTTNNRAVYLGDNTVSGSTLLLPSENARQQRVEVAHEQPNDTPKCPRKKSTHPRTRGWATKP
jgi:hypothetical protein